MRNGNILKKITSILLMTVTVASQLLPFAVTFAAASGESESSEAKVTYSTKTLYHWQRVNSQSDIGKFEGENPRTLVMWGDGVSHAYYMKGKTTTGTDAINDGFIDYGSDGFFTADNRGAWNMWVYKYDINNTGRQMWGCGFFTYGESKWQYLSTDGKSFIWNTNGKTRIFSISAHANSGEKEYVGYNKYTSAGHSMIAYEVDDSDYELEHSNNQLKLDRDSSWDYDQFVLYINDYTMENYSLTSYTVPSGSTLQIDGDIILEDGCTLTVEPGATVSIKGNFINNGKIVNYGTVVVYPTGRITYFDPKDSSGGTIINYGSSYSKILKNTRKSAAGEGNFIVMNGGVVVQPGKNPDDVSFQLKSGANAVIFGLMVIPGSLEMDEAHLRIEKEGMIYSHVTPTKKLGSLENFNAQTMKQYSLTKTGVQNKFYGVKSVVENYGKWENYDEKLNAENVKYITKF